VTSNDLSARQRTAELVARDAGRLALGFLRDGRPPQFELKGPQDVVTEADGAVERSIVAALHAAFPGDTFLGEEGGGAPGERCWVIDPIDGTANFARGLPHWCVSIAFIASGRTRIGVVCDANEGSLYSAVEGGGATRNGAPIRVSATSDIARATVDIGYSRRTEIDDFAGIVRRLLEQGATVTQCGSAALGLARVADGRLDGYVERHLYAWDALAGLLLVEEAGGRVNAFLAGDALARGNETVAATPELYRALAELLEPR
jgi:myo-inositol-1(or 4)-monophosphatase